MKYYFKGTFYRSFRFLSSYVFFIKLSDLTTCYGHYNEMIRVLIETRHIIVQEGLNCLYHSGCTTVLFYNLSSLTDFLGLF